METGNYMWLIKEYQEGVEVNVKEKLTDIWQKIYIEYTELTNDNQSLRYFKLKMRITFLETRIYYVNSLIIQMVSREMDEQTQKQYIDAIREWDLPYKGDKVDVSEVEKLQRFLKLSKNEIGLKNNELDQLKGSGEHTPLTKQVVMVEQALGRNVIDPKTTSVAKWVYMMEVIKEQNTQKKRNLNGK